MCVEGDVNFSKKIYASIEPSSFFFEYLFSLSLDYITICIDWLSIVSCLSESSLLSNLWVLSMVDCSKETGAAVLSSWNKVDRHD